MARIGLPAAIIKKYGMTKKAWQVFRNSKGVKKVKRVAKRAVKRIVRKVKRKRAKTVVRATVVKKRSVSKMVKRKKSKRSLMSNVKGIFGSQTKGLVMDGAIIGGSALVSTLAVNKLPVISEQKAWVRAGAQAGLGILLLMFFRKNKLMVKSALGAVVGSAITLAMPYMPTGFSFSGGRRYSQAELAALTTMGNMNRNVRRLGVPAYNKTSTMGVPVTSRTMGVPVTSRTMGKSRARF